MPLPVVAVGTDAPYRLSKAHAACRFRRQQRGSSGCAVLFGCQGKPCRRGQTVRIPTATVDVGFRDERIGSMSYLVRKNDEALCEGINFISGRYPSFNAETMQDEDIPICATQSFFEPSNP